MLDVPPPALPPCHLRINLAVHQVDAAPAPARDAADAPHAPAPAAPILLPVPAGDAARAAARAAPLLTEQVLAPVAPPPPARRPPAHTLGPLAPPITNLFVLPEELAVVRAAALSSTDDGKVMPIPPIRKGYKGSPLELEKGSRAANQRSLAHLGTFAAVFAGGLLPRLSSLRIENGEWTSGVMPQSVFLHLSSFHSITRLSLKRITLPSITVLLCLVCAFDRLENLDISYLQLDRRVPPASRRWAPSPTLKTLAFALNWPDQLRALDAHAALETSSGSETVLFLSTALSCSDYHALS
ncbi:hypothetical protein WOLCODRAFT_156586 [Wolfiporia cocos MD-104 SS10]|uniref:F-box domain-containing protein n=1 Tax=Wolfiporia cocos (strain MD-104) TaxID=742152 RepID=A0A2H3JDY6_WOLCO|nr:hypothetical protein WOLCODRAFT_156586 [Wolfiporia cocos MD-104 SS10]